MPQTRSQELFAEALRYIPGGVNSPVRAFRAVGGQPFFAQKAHGSRVEDVDGNTYIDYVCTWGPSILGHAHPEVIAAVKAAADRGTSFGIPNPLEVELARKICEWVPSVEKVRMTNSGTEATMSAIRLARGFTRRDKIIKFDGCYHGHVDSLLVKAGSGALTLGQPDSAGIPAALAALTLALPFNDVDALRAAFEQNRGEIAAVIVEPIPANAGLILPAARLSRNDARTLHRARHAAHLRRGHDRLPRCSRRRAGAARRPARSLLLRQGDRRRLARRRPRWPRGHHGFSRARWARSTRRARSPAIRSPWPRAWRSSRSWRSRTFSRSWRSSAQQLEAETRAALKSAGLDYVFYRIGSMFCLFFTGRPVRNLDDAKTADLKHFARFFHALLARGIYIAPSQFETGFLSAAHSVTDIEQTTRAVREALAGG